jgi:ribosomal protein S12 methylthiotransferase accessory factor
VVTRSSSDFLNGSEQVRSLLDSAGSAAFRHTDLRDDLLAVLDRYLQTGLDVIAVDQTTPEHRLRDLACVKVLIPGLVPMTFGHHNRRVVGLPRLHVVPQLLGYRSRPLTDDELNPAPHPFP